ncbi:LPS export ABC transporter periplasmic protein LptC [Candidatus Poribacteria bacterium]|nr:LPS export ABC transporter periplasmic protein LptC [Candidatus Poribacteria bacterium]
MNNLRATLFFLPLVLTLFVSVSCDRKPEKLVPEKETEELPRQAEEPAGLAQQLQDVRYSQTKDGRLQWELTAKSVQQVIEGPTSMQNVTMTYYAADGKATVLTADSGAYDSASNNAALRGNILVKTSDGGSVRTDVLEWNQKAGVLRGLGEVTITKGHTVIQGKGFELSPELETFKMYHVKGTIHRGDVNP